MPLRLSHTTSVRNRTYGALRIMCYSKKKKPEEQNLCNVLLYAMTQPLPMVAQGRAHLGGTNPH